jgi:hypothetical protein
MSEKCLLKKNTQMFIGKIDWEVDMMVCRVCGRECAGEDLLCPDCRNSETQPVRAKELLLRQLVFGILAVVFSAVAFLGIPLAHIFGIILGGIAIFLALYRREAYFSTVGFLLGLAGIGLGMIRMIMIILEG